MKRISFMLIFVMMISTASIAFATDLGYLPYWYSNDGGIARWINTPKTWTSVSDGFSSSDFNTYVNHARNQWIDAGISISTTTSSSNANIIIRGGTYNTMRNYEPSITTSNAGISMIAPNPEGTYRYNSSTKIGYTISNVVYLYIIYKPGGTSPSSDGYKKTVTHELGHSLGWFGHSSNSSDVMYGSSHTQCNLTTRDKLHLTQVY